MLYYEMIVALCVVACPNFTTPYCNKCMGDLNVATKCVRILMGENEE